MTPVQECIMNYELWTHRVHIINFTIIFVLQFVNNNYNVCKYLQLYTMRVI